MSKSHQMSDWKVMAYGKLLEYVAAEVAEKAVNERTQSEGLPGERPMDFGAFQGTKVKLGEYMAVLLLCRSLATAPFDIYRQKAITCVRSDLPVNALTKAIRIASPEERCIQNDISRFNDYGDAIQCRTLDKWSSDARIEEEFYDLVSVGEPIIYLTDTSGQFEHFLPPCPHEFLSLGAFDRELISLVLAYEYPDQVTEETIATLGDLSDGQTFEHITPFDLVCACRAEDPRAAIEYLLRCPRTPKRKADDEDKPEVARAVVALEDLVGYGEAKVAAQDMLSALHGYDAGELDWTDVPRGLLLIGEPGTGKTELARAMSRSAGISFVAGSYSEWQKEGHLGHFLKAMNRTFAAAKENVPSILFLDELDSFQRGLDGSNSSYDQKAVKGILEQLDGIRGCEGVGVVAAANSLEAIPPAVRRSGRFDNIVTIPLPGRSDLATIIRQHLKSEEIEIDADACAIYALGRTGADCAAAVRKGRAAARRARRQLLTSDIVHALSGSFRDLSEGLQFRMAIHECGHAILAHSYPGLMVEFLRLSSKGGQCRVVGQEPFQTSATMHRDRTILMGGRVAEVLALGETRESW